MKKKIDISRSLRCLCAVIVLATIMSACRDQNEESNRKNGEILLQKDFSLISNVDNNLYFNSSELSLSYEFNLDSPSLRKTAICGDKLAVLVSGVDEEYRLWMWVYYFNENGEEIGHFNLDDSLGSSRAFVSYFTGYSNGELVVCTEDMNYAEINFLNQQGNQTRKPLIIEYEKEDILYLSGMQALSNGDFAVLGSQSEGSKLIVYDPELKEKFSLAHKEDMNGILESGAQLFISYSTQNEKGQIIDWLEVIDSETGALKENMDISDLVRGGDLFSVGGQIYSSSQTDLKKIDLEKKEIKSILSWNETDVDRSIYQAISPICVLSEETLFILGMNENEFANNSILMLKQREGNPFEGVVTLTLGGFDIAGRDYLEQAIGQFNKSNDSYRIQIVDYYEGIDYGRDWDEVLVDMKKAELQMYLDVYSGEGPDIMYASSGDSFAHYERNGLLLDLYPLITSDESFEISSLIPNIVAACESEGRLYKLAPHFSVKGFLGDPDITKGRCQWTIDEFNMVSSTLPEGTRMLTNKTSTELLEENLSGSMNCFIDVTTKTAQFDSPEFYQILEWAKTYGQEAQMTPDGRVYEEESSLFVNKKLVLFSDVNMNDLKQGALGDGGMDFIGYPSPGQYKAYIVPEETIAVSSWSENPEGGWEFIKYLLTYDYQLDSSSYKFYKRGLGYPINQEAMDAWCNIELHPELLPENPDATGGEEPVDETEATQIDSAEFEENTKKRLDSCLALIYSADALYYLDPEIMNIINEEAAYYFAGEKSVEDVAVIIQDRVQTLLNE